MSTKLNDTQLAMLSAAAQRSDRCLVATLNLKESAARRMVADKLIAAGLVKEIKAKAGAPAWRRDEELGHSYALKLTAAGAKAIAVNENDDPGFVHEANSLENVSEAAASPPQHAAQGDIETGVAPLLRDQRGRYLLSAPPAWTSAFARVT